MTDDLKQRLRVYSGDPVLGSVIDEAADKIEQLEAALENCRLLAARNRHEDWAQHILRFCLSVGISATTIREAANAKGEK